MQYEDYAAQVAAQKRRREVARMLSEGAMSNDRINAVGGVVVPYSIGEGLSKLGQAWIARRAERKADEEEKGLQRKRSEDVAAALSNYERATDDDQVNSEILRRIESTPDGELMEPVTGQSDARRRLALELMPASDAMELEMRRDIYGTGRAAPGVQSTVVGDDGYYYTVDRLTGTMSNTGVRSAPNVRVVEQEGNVPFGVVTGRGQAGKLLPLGAAPSASSAPGATSTPAPAPMRQPTAGERQRDIETAKADVELATKPEITKQTELAKTEAERVAALPGALADVQKMKRNIEGLLNSPGFDTIYGASKTFDPRNYVGGTDAAGSKARLGQIDAQAFQMSVERMRGLGALSNAEGAKVAAAFTRATDTNQGEEDAREAWAEVLEYFALAEERLRAGTTLRTEARPAAPAPAGGPSDEELLRLYGGS